MNTLIRKGAAVLILVCLLFPALPLEGTNAPLSAAEMSLITGGKEAIDCDAIGAGAYTLCVSLGGGWFACSIVALAAYAGCFAANAIAAN